MTVDAGGCFVRGNFLRSAKIPVLSFIIGVFTIVALRFLP